MQRNRPTNKLDVLGNLDLKPEDAVGDYIESKDQEKLFIKAPYWDVPSTSLELLAIANEREYIEMKNLQIEQFENTKKRKAINAKRIEKMREVQKKLKNRFIEINQFIRDCEDKEHIAVKKIRQENKIQAELNVDITRYKQDIEELNSFLEVLEQTVKEMEPYESVIEEALKHFDTVNTVKDCMDRCDALMLAQVEISEFEQDKLKAIEDMRWNMVVATNDAALTILGLNNELADMERSYNQAKSECAKWEKIIADTKNFIIENEFTKYRILDGINHIHIILCRRRGIDPFLGRNDIEPHLDFIKSEIEIIEKILQACKKEAKKQGTM